MPVNNFGNITIIPITKSATIGEMVDIVNKNFEEILLNGGGPTGPQGLQGLQGLPGATIIGERGEKGEDGTRIFFSDSEIDDGDIVSNVNHREGDIVIDTNGLYYQVEDQSGTLRYAFRINFASISLSSYLVTYGDIDSQGSNDMTDHHYDSSSNNTNTLFIAERSEVDASNDRVKYRRLCLGDVPNILIDNSPLTLVNIIPSSATDADENPYSQLVIKHRSAKSSDLSTSSFKLKHEETDDLITSDIENGNVKISLINNKSDSDLDRLFIKAKNLILNGDSSSDNPDNNIEIYIDGTGSTVNSAEIIDINAPVGLNKGISAKQADYALNNSGGFSIAVTGTNEPVQKVTISIPSNKHLGRITSISGGIDDQILVIKSANTNPKGIVINQSGNIVLSRPTVNLREGRSIILKKDGSSWYEVGGSDDDYQITYVSTNDIDSDYDNLIDDGIYMVYRDTNTDYFENYINNPATAGDGREESEELGNTPAFIPYPIENAIPNAADGYGIITYVNRTYNDIVSQKQINLLNGDVWYRLRYHDGTWSAWEKVIKIDATESIWSTMTIADTGYVASQILVGNGDHRYIYNKFDKTCNIKLYIKGACQTDNPAYIEMNLPDDVNPNTTQAPYTHSPCTLIINENSESVKIVPAWIQVVPAGLQIHYIGDIFQNNTIRIIADINIPIT